MPVQSRLKPANEVGQRHPQRAEPRPKFDHIDSTRPELGLDNERLMYRPSGVLQARPASFRLIRGRRAAPSGSEDTRPNVEMTARLLFCSSQLSTLLGLCEHRLNFIADLDQTMNAIEQLRYLLHPAYFEHLRR